MYMYINIICIIIQFYMHHHVIAICTAWACVHSCIFIVIIIVQHYNFILSCVSYSSYSYAAFFVLKLFISKYTYIASSVVLVNQN